MLERESGKWTVRCDADCGEANYTGQTSYRQAVNVARNEGWVTRKYKDGGWRNHCPSCSSKGDPDLERAGIGFFKKVATEE